MDYKTVTPKFALRPIDSWGGRVNWQVQPFDGKCIANTQNMITFGTDEVTQFQVINSNTAIKILSTNDFKYHLQSKTDCLSFSLLREWLAITSVCTTFFFTSSSLTSKNAVSAMLMAIGYRFFTTWVLMHTALHTTWASHAHHVGVKCTPYGNYLHSIWISHVHFIGIICTPLTWVGPLSHVHIPAFTVEGI